MGLPKKRPTQAGAGAPVVELIVRRGALKRFDSLKQNTADLPVKLSWDRRLQERRRAATGVEREARRIDRRKKPPFTWDVADFVVVEPPARRRTQKRR
jgi:hypothetical protein